MFSQKSLQKNPAKSLENDFNSVSKQLFIEKYAVMKDFEKQYAKAASLMTEAIAKYNEGDYKGAQSLREEATKLFEEADKTMFITVNDDDALYGNNRNFGIIYHIFEANMDTLLATQKGREVLKEFTNKIKKDKLLKQEFDTYQCLCSGRDIESAEFFVNEAVSALPKFTKEDIIEKNKELLTILRNGEINEIVEIPDDKMALYEAVEYLMFNKATLKNADKVADSKFVIKEHIENSAENKPINIVKENVEKINNLVEKYDQELNDDEKELVEDYVKTDDKQKLFNERKERVMKKLNETMEADNDKERWEGIYKVINEKKYDKNTALYEIAQMVEIENILDIQKPTD